MRDVQFAGEYNLENCEIISSAGVAVDISPNIVEINIFENIFKNSLSGSIIIADTNNLCDNLPIIGQEYIALKIVTPGLEETEQVIDFTENVFCLYEVGSKTPAATGAEVVELKFCSPELLRNERVRVSKSFEQTTDQIVKAVMENSKYLNTKKKVFLESTLGIRKIVSPNYHPFQLIKNLTREAMATADESPHFLFYENIFGFNFRSVQSLYSQGSQGEYHVGDMGFDEEYTASGDSGKIIQAYKRVINFSIPNRNNSLADIKSGMLGSTIIMHDIFNKKYQKSMFKYFEDHNKYMRLEASGAPKYNNTLIDEENTVENFTDARIHLHPTSITNDNLDSQYITVPPTVKELIEQGVDRSLAIAAVEQQQQEVTEGNKDYISNQADKWLLHRNQRMHELNTGMTVNMSIHGNTTVAVGQVIEINVPINGTDHEEVGQSKYQSGLYLISKVRHIFSQPTRTHMIQLQATKDSYPIELESKGSGKEPKTGSPQFIPL